MTSTLEPSVFFANLKPDLEERKVLIAKLKMMLFGPTPSTVYISGPGNTGKTMLISLIKKLTDLISVPVLFSGSWPTLNNKFIWIRNDKEYENALNFGNKAFKEHKVFIICSDEFPLTKGNPQIDIVLDRVFDSQAHFVDLSNYVAYEEYIKTY